MRRAPARAGPEATERGLGGADLVALPGFASVVAHPGLVGQELVRVVEGDGPAAAYAVVLADRWRAPVWSGPAGPVFARRAAMKPGSSMKPRRSWNGRLPKAPRTGASFSTRR